MSIALDKFLELPTEDVAELVKAHGPKVIVCPVNGTRRWYFLEHGSNTGGVVGEDYIARSMQAFIDLFTTFFRLGVPTLLSPALSTKIASRGEEYMLIAANAILQLATQPSFLSFYKGLGIRVKFYGNYKQILGEIGRADITKELENLETMTAAHTSHHLLFGLFAEDELNIVAGFVKKHARTAQEFPSRDEIVAYYYGEVLPPVDIFIGMSRFATYDMPLLSTGREDLYFLAAPTLYLQEPEIRRILYDHIFARRTGDSYEGFEDWDWNDMRDYYKKNRSRIFGVGHKHHGIWYPEI